jgi:uncharacterized protein YjbI with pentapeptide repeats
MEKLSKSKIKEIIQKHKYWLKGNKIKGKRADFSEKILKIVNFRKAKLQNANFKNSKLKIIEFVEADLKNASFENAELTKVDFHNANLTGTNFKFSIFKKVHIGEETLKKLKNITEIQKKEIITSYRKFMWKSIF